MIDVRQEKPADKVSIRYANQQAFGSDGEANLVDALRNRNALVLSMVALQNKEVIGHIAFTEVTIRNARSEFRALGLGPMCVLPSYQRKGIGSQLAPVALDKCRQLGHDIVVVVGHPAFYSSLGFQPANTHGIECEFDVPDEAFMVLELRENALAGISGVATYPEESRNV